MNKEKNTLNIEKENNVRQRFSVEEYIAKKYGIDKEQSENRTKKKEMKNYIYPIPDKNIVQKNI